jgi:hypothetical protein
MPALPSIYLPTKASERLERSIHPSLKEATPVKLDHRTGPSPPNPVPPLVDCVALVHQPHHRVVETITKTCPPLPIKGR